MVSGGLQLAKDPVFIHSTFGTRLVTVYFHGHHFEWDFLVASITVPIIGTDFLCANGLLVDVANRRLIGAVSFATFLCETGSQAINTWPGFVIVPLKYGF